MVPRLPEDVGSVIASCSIHDCYLCERHISMVMMMMLIPRSKLQPPLPSLVVYFVCVEPRNSKLQPGPCAKEMRSFGLFSSSSTI